MCCFVTPCSRVLRQARGVKASAGLPAAGGAGRKGGECVGAKSENPQEGGWKPTMQLLPPLPAHHCFPQEFLSKYLFFFVFLSPFLDEFWEQS